MNTGSFYGILPKYIRHHKELKANTKIIYSEIMACLDDNGICTKRNIYFSKVLGISKDTASRSINDLKKFGFIKVVIEHDDKTKKFLKRYITPSQNLLGVGTMISNPYKEKSLGGDVKDDVLEGLGMPTYTDKSRSLLLHNNTTYTIYSDGNKPHIPLKKEINDKQLNVLRKLVYTIYNKQSLRYPKMFRKAWEQDMSFINESINCIYSLITEDKYDFEDVKNTLNYAMYDEFWGKNLLTLATLRTQSENGFTKFQNLHHKFNQ